ncbi:MAG: diguanylate cyclase, partial [Methylococcales bacterium]|nr:diguanylate cyclase [Methylococcales bacterium]
GIKVTVSIGIAQLNSAGEEFSNLLKRADIAVYQAKEQGRNRVVVI